MSVFSLGVTTKLDVMTQMPPTWLMAVISGGALLVATTTLLTKALLDKKEERVQLHKDLLNAEKEKVAQEKEKVAQERAKLASTINLVIEIFKSEIEANKLDPISALRLREVIQNTEKFPEELDKAFKDCWFAAEWLNSRKSSWANQAFRESIRRHSESIPFKNRKAFKTDISKCFDWVYQCLLRGGTRTTRLSDFVSLPTPLPPEFYEVGIRHVMAQQEWTGLTFDQRELLQNVVNRLIELLHKRSNQSLTS